MSFKYYDYEPYLPSSAPTRADVYAEVAKTLVDILGWASARYAESKALDKLKPEIAKRIPGPNGGVLVRLAYQKAEVGPADYEGPRVFRFAAIVGAGFFPGAVFRNRGASFEPPVWKSWKAEDEYLWITN